MQGQRGMASRLGNAKTGITAHVNGWNCGIQVIAHVNDKGEDVFDVWQTGGSNGYTSGKPLARVTYDSEQMKAIVG